MSIAKTMSVEISSYLSTTHNRRALSDMRFGQSVSGNSGENDYMVAPNTYKDIGAIENVVLLATDSDGVKITMTNGAGSLQVTMRQMMMLTDAFTNIRITNTNTSGDPVRVRVIYG